SEPRSPRTSALAARFYDRAHAVVRRRVRRHLAPANFRSAVTTEHRGADLSCAWWSRSGRLDDAPWPPGLCLPRIKDVEGFLAKQGSAALRRVLKCRLRLCCIALAKLAWEQPGRCPHGACGRSRAYRQRMYLSGSSSTRVAQQAHAR